MFISVNFAIVSFKQEMRESPLQKFTNENEQFLKKAWFVIFIYSNICKAGVKESHLNETCQNVAKKQTLEFDRYLSNER